MNKKVILICIIVALVSGIIGLIIGINVNGNNKNENELVGTYKTNTWNGKEAIISLQKDKTMVCPNGSGTWIMEDGKLYIEYESNTVPILSEDGYKTYEKNKKKQEVLIVENGLMLYDHFFEKVK